METPTPIASLTPEAAQAEINASLQNQTGPLWDSNHLEHAAAVDRYGKLQEVITNAPPPGAATEPAPTPLIALPAHPEGQHWPSEFVGQLNEYVGAVETHGMPRAEAGELFRYAVGQLREEPPDPEVTVKTLEAEWGEAFRRNLLAANLVFERLPVATREFLNGYGFGVDPVVLRALAKYGAPLVDAWERGQARKQAIEADKDFLWSHRDPTRHMALVAEWQSLVRQLTPD